MPPLRGVRVVVAGAGLAGLTAAHALAKAGAVVRVFEARDRVGGRVWTYREAAVAPFHAELGGELIESDHKALRGLCREFNLPVARILLRGFGLAIANGKRMRVLPRQTPLWKKFSEYFSSQVDALEAAKGEWTSSAASAVARQSVQEVLDGAKAPFAVKALAVALRNLYAADPHDLSALVAAEEVKGGGDPSALALYRVVGGNDRLTDAIAQQARYRIDRRHRVDAVAQSARQVRVAVRGPSQRLATITADFLVMALPVPVLRTIAFTPPLPDGQRAAIDALSMGPATRALLRFSSPWWRRAGLPRAFGTNLPIGAVWDAAEEQPDAAILTLLAGGGASAQLQRVLAHDGPRKIARQLRWFNGGPHEMPEVFSISWERDPLAGGAYEYFSPSFDPALQPLLGRAAGRVFFAGAHTSRDYPGYMNGAVESGQRAVSEIIALAKVLHSY